MIVYVESNFVLELALVQEESVSCENILRLAETGAIRIAMPAFSLGEPYETLVRRHRERRSLGASVVKEMEQLRRSTPYKERVKNADVLTDLLAESGKQEAERLNTVVSRLIETATILPTDRDVMRKAMQAQQTLDLSPQDSIVYASVQQNVMIEKEVQCFINKNVKDFLIPQIEDEFAAYNCKLLGRFAAGLAYITAGLATTNPTKSTHGKTGD